MRTLKARSMREAINELGSRLGEQGMKIDEQGNRFDLMFKEYKEKSDREFALWRDERREMDARIAADRKEASDRIERDRAATEARLAADREAANARLQQEIRENKREFAAQRRWLVANFLAVVVGGSGIFAAIVLLLM